MRSSYIDEGWFTRFDARAQCGASPAALLYLSLASFSSGGFLSLSAPRTNKAAANCLTRVVELAKF